MSVDRSLPAERRQRQDLRAIFDAVVALVDPFVQGGSVSLDYWAYRTVRDAYPEVDEQGLRIVLDAAIHTCRARINANLQNP